MGMWRPDPDIAPTQLTRYDGELRARHRVAHNEELCRQQLTKTPVNLADGIDRDRVAAHAATVDPALNGHMSLRFTL